MNLMYGKGRVFTIKIYLLKYTHLDQESSVLFLYEAVLLFSLLGDVWMMFLKKLVLSWSLIEMVEVELMMRLSRMMMMMMTGYFADCRTTLKINDFEKILLLYEKDNLLVFRCTCLYSKLISVNMCSPGCLDGCS